MTTVKSEYQTITRQFQATATAAFTILAVGCVFYHIVEKLSWVDALYFTVITLATVGYGDITPKTELGKLFTVLYVLLGVGIIATFANLMIKRASLRHNLKEKSHPKSAKKE